jgi:hypothetical protein
MKELVKKYIEENVIFEKLDIKNIKNDISTIVNKYTNIDKKSDNSCVVTVKQEKDNGVRIGVFFKDEDKDNLKWKLHDWFVTREDVEFNAIEENW